MRDAHPLALRELPDDIPDDIEEKVIFSALIYLEELGFCESGVVIGIGEDFAWGGSTITAQGIDYLEDDGGMTAELNVVTVRFEAETIRQLLAARVDASDTTPESKSLLKAAIADLPASALKVATTELVKQGLNQMPNAIQWLRALAGLG
jgi:hypothetical protein